MNEQERASERVSETTVGLGGAGEVTATRLGEQNTYNIYSLVPALQIQGDFTAELSGKGRSNTKKSHTFALKMAASLNVYYSRNVKLAIFGNKTPMSQAA